MSYKKINIIETILFIVFWIIIFLLGADFPPPLGFWKIGILVIIIALIQSIYLKCLFKYKMNKKSFINNILFFISGGFLVALFTSLPFNTNNLQNIIIWFTVIIVVSIIYGMFFWVINYLIIKKTKDIKK